MVSLQVDRTRLTFAAVQRAAGNARNFRIADDGFPVKNDRHESSDQGDVIGLPLAGTFRGHRAWREETIHRADHVIGWFGPLEVLDLDFIPAAQVYTAVASLRIPEFDMQPEIAIFSVGDDVGTGMRAAQDAVFREPLIGAGGVPSSECFAIEDRHRAVPHRLSGAVKGGRL